MDGCVGLWVDGWVCGWGMLDGYMNGWMEVIPGMSQACFLISRISNNGIHPGMEESYISRSTLMSFTT